MRKLVSTRDLTTNEWLKYRKQGIGGSDAGAVCGLNPYRSAMAVYLDKISDETEEIDNEAMRQGREFEDYVARRFMEASGKKVRRANMMFCHEKYPFMIADVDRMIVGENAGLECKTASPFSNLKTEEFDIIDIDEVIRKMFSEGDVTDLPSREQAEPVLYVLTNKCQNRGAIGMLRTDLLEKFAERKKCDLYILPCSIHELLLVRDDAVPAEELRKTVRSVNHGVVDEIERLSDEVYHYRRGSGKVTIAA